MKINHKQQPLPLILLDLGVTIPKNFVFPNEKFVELSFEEF